MLTTFQATRSTLRLYSVKLGVLAFVFEKFLVRTRLDYLAVVESVDGIGVLDRREPVRDCDYAVVAVHRFYRSLNLFLQRRGGYDPIFYALSFVGAEDLARHLDAKAQEQAKVFMSQVVPPPTAPDTEEILPSAQEYIRLLAKYYPKQTPNVVGLEGYLNARVLVEGLRRTGRNLTRQRFLDAFREMDDFALGGQTRIRFGPRDNQGLDRVYLTRLDNGSFRLLEQ